MKGNEGETAQQRPIIEARTGMVSGQTITLCSICFAQNLFKVSANKPGSEMLSAMPVRGLGKSCLLPAKNGQILL